MSLLSTRLFFLYNRATSEHDLNGTEMRKKQDRVFKDALLAAWKLASDQHQISNDGEIEPPDFVNLLDKTRDIARVQPLNMSNYAPDDIPEPTFGITLARFNDHIYKSISETRKTYPGTSILHFIQRINDLENACELGKFYMVFPDVMCYRQRKRRKRNSKGPYK